MKKDLVLFFDGACSPTNPNGNVGTGFLVYEVEGFKVRDKGTKYIKSSYDSIKKYYEYSDYTPFSSGKYKSTTNNMAEHKALNNALKWIRENRSEINSIMLFGDNEMVVKQASGVIGVRNTHSAYYDYYVKNIDIIDSLRGLKMDFVWIPREYNEKADELSKNKETFFKKY